MPYLRGRCGEPSSVVALVLVQTHCISAVRLCMCPKGTSRHWMELHHSCFVTRSVKTFQHHEPTTPVFDSLYKLYCELAHPMVHHRDWWYMSKHFWQIMFPNWLIMVAAVGGLTPLQQCFCSSFGWGMQCPRVSCCAVWQVTNAIKFVDPVSLRSSNLRNFLFSQRRKWQLASDLRLLSCRNTGGNWREQSKVVFE